MTSRLLEQGSFYDVTRLPSVILDIVRSIPNTENMPLIIDVMLNGSLFSTCIFRKKIYTFYNTGIFVEGSEEPPDVEGPWNSLYFILIHFQRIGDEQSVRDLCPLHRRRRSY